MSMTIKNKSERQSLVNILYIQVVVHYRTYLISEIGDEVRFSGRCGRPKEVWRTVLNFPQHPHPTQLTETAETFFCPESIHCGKSNH
jgi:hypothetical protein